MSILLFLVKITSTSCFIFLPCIFFACRQNIRRCWSEQTGNRMHESGGWYRDALKTAVGTLGTQHSCSKHPRSYTYVNFFSQPTPGVRSTGAVSGSPRGVTAPVSWNSGVECHLRRFTSSCFVSGFYLLTEASDDPVNRTAALLSLICALISLIYGCMYNVKFGVTRNMFHASRWAHIAQEHLSLHNAAKVHCRKSTWTCSESHKFIYSWTGLEYWPKRYAKIWGVVDGVLKHWQDT